MFFTIKDGKNFPETDDVATKDYLKLILGAEQIGADFFKGVVNQLILGETLVLIRKFEEKNIIFAQTEKIDRSLIFSDFKNETLKSFEENISDFLHEREIRL